MALQFQGAPEILESDLVKALGLKVPPHKAIDYPSASISADPMEWGIQIGGHHFETLLALLRAKGISLHACYVPVSSIARTSFATWLQENLSAGVSLIVGYDYKSVFNDGAHVGHMSIVESVDDGAGTIIVVEPEAGLRLLTNETALFQGMQVHGGGTWLFSRSAANMTTEFV